MSTPSTSLVSDYITSMLDQIQSTVPKNARIDDSIRFEITTVNQQDAGGKINASILNFGAKVDADISEIQTQKVSFAIKFPTEAEIATAAAIKANAEAERAKSEIMSESLNKSLAARHSKTT